MNSWYGKIGESDALKWQAKRMKMDEGEPQAYFQCSAIHKNANERRKKRAAQRKSVCLCRNRETKITYN